MPTKIISIVVLAILTTVSQNLSLANSKYSSDPFMHSQSIFCAETTDEENEYIKKEAQEGEEEEEPDCD